MEIKFNSQVDNKGIYVCPSLSNSTFKIDVFNFMKRILLKLNLKVKNNCDRAPSKQPPLEFTYDIFASKFRLKDVTGMLPAPEPIQSHLCTDGN